MATTSERLAGSEQARGLVAEAPRAEAMERTLNDSLRRMMESIRPDGIFGAVVERDGVTLIPCAEVTVNFGMGGGSGIGPATTNKSRKQAAEQATSGETAGAQPLMSTGSGVGGGGGARGRPVAVIVMSQGKTRVLPVVDVTRFMLAMIPTMGIIAFMVGQMIVARSDSRNQRPGVAMSAIRIARAMRKPLSREA